MKTIMADFILWRVWLYLLNNIGEPGHGDALHLVDGCMAQTLEEAFFSAKNTDYGVTASEQLRTARKLAHWYDYAGDAE